MISARAMRLFVSCLGAEAGNLALRMMTVSGVYLGRGASGRAMETVRA
jgi:glucokinase